MSKDQLIINTPENSTTSSFDHTDRSLMSKRVRALLHDKEGSELLFEAIFKERNNDKEPDVTITPELLERLKAILNNEQNDSDESGNVDTHRTIQNKAGKKHTKPEHNPVIKEHSVFYNVFHFFGWSHPKNKVSHNH